MVTVVFNGNRQERAYGLTQWDYGQELKVISNQMEIPDGTEVQFYQGLLKKIETVRGGNVRIPDAMLQNPDEITAYIYVRSADSGETVFLITLPVFPRPRPEDYVLPEYTEYNRLLPPGGEKGGTLRKKEDADYAVEWGHSADDISLEGGILQLLEAGKPVGSPVRLPAASTGGREIELKNDGTSIVWRYTDSNDWHELARLSDITGPAGETPEFEIRDGHLYAIYKE